MRYHGPYDYEVLDTAKVMTLEVVGDEFAGIVEFDDDDEGDIGDDASMVSRSMCTWS